jgi:hypothetical protein
MNTNSISPRAILSQLDKLVFDKIDDDHRNLMNDYRGKTLSDEEASYIVEEFNEIQKRLRDLYSNYPELKSIMPEGIDETDEVVGEEYELNDPRF